MENLNYPDGTVVARTDTDRNQPKTASNGGQASLASRNGTATAYTGVTQVHDANGNITKLTPPVAGAAQITLDWDGESRLLSASRPDQTLGGATHAAARTDFTFDALHRRIGKIIFNGGAKHYYHADGNGNVIALTSATAQAEAHYRYSAFGGLLHTALNPAATPAAHAFAQAQPWRFSTKYWDRESEAQQGMHYYGYRTYVPRIGRWLSRDPIGEKGGKSLAVYALNSPTNSVDFLGLFLECIFPYEVPAAERAVPKDVNVFWSGFNHWVRRGVNGCTNQFIQLVRNAPLGYFGLGGTAKPFWDVPGNRPSGIFPSESTTTPETPFYPKDDTNSFQDDPDTGPFGGGGRYADYEVCVVCVNDKTGHYDAIGPCHSWQPWSHPQGGMPMESDLGSLRGTRPSAGFIHKLNKDFPGKITSGTKQFYTR